MASPARRSSPVILWAVLVASPSTAWALEPPASSPTSRLVGPWGVEYGPPIAVVGRLTRGGRPVPGVDVVAWKSAGVATDGGTCAFPSTRSRARPTAEDGSFDLVVPGSGLYCIRVEAVGHDYPVSVVEVPDAPTHPLDIVLPSACLSGSVIDKATGAPVAHANVNAREERPRWGAGNGTSSRDGHFHVDLEPGEYSVSAWLEKGGVARHQVRSVGGEGLSGVVLGIVPGLEITGRVVDAAGRGVAGVEVREDPPSPSFRRLGWTATGSGGFFRIDELLDQRFVLTAESESRYAIRGDVKAGDRDVALRLRDPGHVNVLVRDPQGQPVGDVEVTVESIDGARAAVFIFKVTDDEGLAKITVPVGTVGLAVTAEVEPGRPEVIGEASVSVGERESVSTVLAIRKRPPPPLR